MKHFLDTTNMVFTVSKDVEEKVDQNKVQRRDRDGRPMWSVQVVAMQAGEGASVISVTVAGEMPKVNLGQTVTLASFEAMPWNQNGKHGVAYRATEIKPLAGPSGKAGS
ncbi:hypothetical protein AB0M43_22205 [Longispora sp. NPDC051575]|uniref:hypothetical protein n=1 Tax=Longispora sp. NPDC051575 TaxID=3154943 RepID=UPI003428DBAA